MFDLVKKGWIRMIRISYLGLQKPSQAVGTTAGDGRLSERVGLEQVKARPLGSTGASGGVAFAKDGVGEQTLTARSSQGNGQNLAINIY